MIVNWRRLELTHRRRCLHLLQGQSQLSVVLRQSTIAGFYKAEPSVMEALESQSAKAKGRSLAAAAGQTSLGSSGAVVDDV